MLASAISVKTVLKESSPPQWSCHLASGLGLDAKFQTTELPESIAHLDTNLANVDIDTLMPVEDLCLRH
jgi:hypothetical protein